MHTRINNSSISFATYNCICQFHCFRNMLTSPTLVLITLDLYLLAISSIARVAGTFVSTTPRFSFNIKLANNAREYSSPKYSPFQKLMQVCLHLHHVQTLYQHVSFSHCMNKNSEDLQIWVQDCAEKVHSACNEAYNFTT